MKEMNDEKRVCLQTDSFSKYIERSKKYLMKQKIVKKSYRESLEKFLRIVYGKANFVLGNQLHFQTIQLLRYPLNKKFSIFSGFLDWLKKKRLFSMGEDGKYQFSAIFFEEISREFLFDGKYDSEEWICRLTSLFFRKRRLFFKQKGIYIFDKDNLDDFLYGGKNKGYLTYFSPIVAAVLEYEVELLRCFLYENNDYFSQKRIY